MTANGAKQPFVSKIKGESQRNLVTTSTFRLQLKELERGGRVAARELRRDFSAPQKDAASCCKYATTGRLRPNSDLPRLPRRSVAARHEEDGRAVVGRSGEKGRNAGNRGTKL
jgi:hypothetical protein